MKVLHIINSLATGGAEKLILETLPFINQNGINADLLLLNNKKHSFYKELETQKCCNIYSIGNYSIYNPYLIFKILPYLKKYEIIHIHLFPSMYWVAIAHFLSHSKAKLIFTEHSTNNRRINNIFFKLTEKFVYQQFENIVCISDEVKHVLINYLPKLKSKLVVIENGVNIENIKKANEIKFQTIDNNYNEENKYIIQVSGFRKEKDQPTLIRAMVNLPEEIKLILVGDGTTKNYCIMLVNKLNLENRVFFLGNRIDVPSLLKSVDVIILSSHYEGLSLSSIEGMASGKPFIGSDVPGLRDLVKGAGVLFPLGDEKILANEISKLLDNPIYYKEVVNKCLERAKDYDISLMISKTIDLYTQVSKK